MTADAVVPVGTEITVRHFVPGQFVDVTGTGKGKGFAGVMKRHGFAGMHHPPNQLVWLPCAAHSLTLRLLPVLMADRA